MLKYELIAGGSEGKICNSRRTSNWRAWLIKIQLTWFAQEWGKVWTKTRGGDTPTVVGNMHNAGSPVCSELVINDTTQMTYSPVRKGKKLGLSPFALRVVKLVIRRGEEKTMKYCHDCLEVNRVQINLYILLIWNVEYLVACIAKINSMLCGAA